MTIKKNREDKLNFLKQKGSLNPHANKVTDDIFVDSDFFDSFDLVQVKYEMIRKVKNNKVSIAHAAKSFGFSRPSFYQAQAAFEQNGLLGLVPQQRGPKQRHKLSQEIVNCLLDALENDPSLKPKDLVLLIKVKFKITVHVRSVERALNEHKKK